MRSKLQTDIANRLFVLSAIVVMGCGGSPDGPPIGTVTGLVTVNKTPAEGVIVTFTPVSGGRMSQGVSDADGRYELAITPTRLGALVGDHNVSVEGAPPAIDDGDTVTSDMLVEATPLSPEALNAIKKVEVEEGSNTIDLSFP